MIVETRTYQKTKTYTGVVVSIDGIEVGVVFRNGGRESSWFAQVGIGREGWDLANAFESEGAAVDAVVKAVRPS